MIRRRAHARRLRTFHVPRASLVSRSPTHPPAVTVLPLAVPIHSYRLAGREPGAGWHLADWLADWLVGLVDEDDAHALYTPEMHTNVHSMEQAGMHACLHVCMYTRTRRRQKEWKGRELRPYIHTYIPRYIALSRPSPRYIDPL
ncbi:hypothetical protein BKA81DRAFT_34344 [Phyllosticta paracitricarpa]